jgi:hypothetical protein
MFLPNIDPFEEGGVAGCEIAFIGLYHWFEGAFGINFVLTIVMFFDEFFLRFDSIVIEMFPNGLYHFFSLDMLER